MFDRSCGATTSFTTQISILNAGEKPEGSGNAFVADSDHEAAGLGDWGGPWAEMRWLANDRLLIRYAHGARIFDQDDRVSGVAITYRSVKR